MKILIPFDFSECAITALRYGFDLLKPIEDSCKILIHHSLTDFKPSEHHFEKYLEKQKEKIEEIVSHLKPDHTEVQIHICTGGLIPNLEKLCERAHPDFLITGTKGKEGLMKWLFGSNSSMLTDYIKTPTIIVPEGFEFKPHNEIIVASDLRNLQGKEIFHPLYPIVDAYQPIIRLVHISSLKDDFSYENFLEKNKQCKWLGEMGNVTFYDLSDSSLEKGLERFANEFPNTGCMVFIKRKKKGFLEQFKSSNSKNWIYQTELPSIILHDGQA